MNFKICLKFYRNIMHNILINQICSLLNWNWFVISQQRQVERKSEMQSQRLFQTHYFFLTESSFQEHSFWALRMKLALKIEGNVGGDSSLKQCLLCWGNIMTVVFSKWLELGVTSCAHSVLISFGIELACDFSLKSQKPCQGFMKTLLRFQCLLRLPFWASSGAISMVLAELLCFSLLSSSVIIFILKFFVAARL